MFRFNKPSSGIVLQKFLKMYELYLYAFLVTDISLDSNQKCILQEYYVFTTVCNVMTVIILA